MKKPSAYAYGSIITLRLFLISFSKIIFYRMFLDDRLAESFKEQK